MTIMKTAELIFPIVIFVFVATFVCLGAFVFGYSVTVMRFPLIVGMVTSSLCGLQIVRVMSGGPGRDAASDEQRDAPTGSVPVIGPGILWLLSIVPAVYLLGYVIGLPAYLFLYLKAQRESWLMAGGLALLCLAIVYSVFMNLLNVPLPVYPIGWP